MAQHSLRVALLAALAASAWGLDARAAVSPDEAARLKTDLTPTGAERAGNKDGTIPAWKGGMTGAVPGDVPGKRRGDPFKDEKPLLRIDAKNMEQHADKLTPGIAAMLKKYPDTFRVDVYTTHRTFAAPQWVYDNTFKNATRAKIAGYNPEGAIGGVPFPIPKTGAEVIWNHLLRWRPPAYRFNTRQWQVTPDNRQILSSDSVGDTQMPYFFQEATPDSIARASYWASRLLISGPPLRAGEGIVGFETLDPDKSQAWVYLTGQRRVRKLPNACCDTPAAPTGGIMSFDEINLWNGRIDRFDWKLIGKKEMYIPYNANRILQPTKDAAVLGKNHLNPDLVRWELHRVWVIDAELRPGQRHVAKRSRYYCDEDSWSCVLAERYDGKDQLWRVLWDILFAAPDVPGVMEGPWGMNDLIAGGYFAANLANEKAEQFPVMPRYQDNHFTPEALAGESVR